jgi:uncharacterized lipoprotein YddW (UPF0748 family)
MRISSERSPAATLSILEESLTNAFGDEANIAYVGFTRSQWIASASGQFFKQEKVHSALSDLWAFFANTIYPQ